jgi:hypothetical protein
LKSRSGHHAPPARIRYYGNDGHFILSSGRDRSLRAFSTVRDAQTFELSQGEYDAAYAARVAKDPAWDNCIDGRMSFRLIGEEGQKL